MLPRDDRWNSMARSALRDDLYAAHAALARDVLVTTEPGADAGGAPRRSGRTRTAPRSAVPRQTLGEIWESDSFGIATLSVALRAIRTLVTACTLPD